jgi:hypothetical protein
MPLGVFVRGDGDRRDVVDAGVIPSRDLEPDAVPGRCLVAVARRTPLLIPGCRYSGIQVIPLTVPLKNRVRHVRKLFPSPVSPLRAQRRPR